MKIARRTKELCAVGRKPGVIQRRLTRTFGKGAAPLVVENVPVVARPNCGDSYMTAERFYEIERIKAHRRSLTKKRSVATMSFA